MVCGRTAGWQTRLALWASTPQSPGRRSGPASRMTIMASSGVTWLPGKAGYKTAAEPPHRSFENSPCNTGGVHTRAILRVSRCYQRNSWRGAGYHAKQPEIFPPAFMTILRVILWCRLYKLPLCSLVCGQGWYEAHRSFRRTLLQPRR